MTLEFRSESLMEIRPEVEPLLKRHWKEVALNKDSVPLDPDWAVYRQIEASGAYNLTAARDGERLVGYAASFIVPNPHYRSLRIADCDVFWLDPDYRRGTAGAKLLAASERDVCARGANKVVLKTKLNPNLGPLFERLGYVEIERVYAKLMV